MKKQKSKIRASLLLLGSLFLSGCSPEEVIPKGEVEAKEITQEVAIQEEETPKEEEIILKVETLFEENTLAYTLYERALQVFEMDHENLIIQQSSSKADDQWKASILLDFMVGNEPDILYFSTGEEAKILIEQDKVVSIQEIRESYEEYGDHILEGAIQRASYPSNQKSYALPMRGSYEGLFCNDTLFETANVPLPTDIESFEKSIDALLEQGITPFATPLEANPEPFLEHLFMAYHGSEAKKASTLEENQEEWMFVLERLMALYEKGAFLQTALSESEESIKQAFIHQEAAMYIGDDTILPSILEVDTTSIFAMPTAKEEKSSLIVNFGEGYYLTRKVWENEEKRELAMDLITALTDTPMIEGAIKSEGKGVAATQVKAIEGLSSLSTLGTILAKETPNWEPPISQMIEPSGWEYLLEHIPYLLEGSMTKEEVMEQSIAREK